jgi:hypothetical protein
MERCCKTSSLSLVAHEDDIKSRLAEKLASYRRRLNVHTITPIIMVSR